MMMDVYRCVSVFVLICYIPSSIGIKCYECNSEITTTNCGAKLDATASSKYVVDNCRQCLLETTTSNRTSYSRQCLSSVTATGCTTTPTASGSEEKCYCSQDLCNKSPQRSIAVLSILISFLITFYVL